MSWRGTADALNSIIMMHSCFMMNIAEANRGTPYAFALNHLLLRMRLKVSWPPSDDELNSCTVCANDFFFSARQYCRLQPLQNVDKVGERFAHFVDDAPSGADDVDPVSFRHGLVQCSANRVD